MAMITKGTIVVRTERALGKAFDKYLCMGYEAIGTIFKTTRTVDNRAAYATGSSIPGKGFRLATALEIKFFEKGFKHIDMIMHPKWIKSFGVEVKKSVDAMADYKELCELYGIKHNPLWEGGTNYYGIEDLAYRSSIYSFGTRVFDSVHLFKLSLEQFYNTTDLKLINTNNNNKNDKNENTEKASVPNTGQRENGISCSKAPSGSGFITATVRPIGNKTVFSRRKAKITGRVLGGKTVSSYDRGN